MLAILLTPAHPGSPLTLTDGKPLPAHLREQLRAVGARDVVLTADLGELAVLASGAREPVLLCSGDLVAHTAVLRHLATSPVPGTVALVLPDSPGAAEVVEERGQVTGARFAGEMAAEAPGAAPTGAFGGALRVAVADLPVLAAAARGAEAAAQRPDAPPALDLLLTALAGGDSTIFAHRVRLLVAHRVADPAEVARAEADVNAVDSDAAELRLSVKEKDDFFTTYFVSTWSPYLTRLAARIGLGPTGVTAISVLCAVTAAVLFGFGGRPALVTGAVLLYLGFVLDCVDGQVARYTRRFSAWGGWLDTMADRAKEYLVYAGLAVGVERSDLGNGWALAIAALTLQTVRHMTDTWYGALHDEAAKRPRPAAAPGTAGGTGPAGVVAAGGLGDRLSRASTRVQADTGSLSYWLKRTVVFPIGERWALIALTVALFNPLVSLVAVLVWGGLAAAYTLALRTLRARSMRVAVLTGVDTMLHRDDGPVAQRLGAAGRGIVARLGPLPLALFGAAASAALLGVALTGLTDGDARWVLPLTAVVVLLAALPAALPHAGPLDWLVPAALRAAEYLFVIAVGVATDAPGSVTFALLFVMALRHYDLTARLEKRERAPLLRSIGLGWDGRLIFLAAAVMIGPADTGPVAMRLLAGYLLVIFAVNALTGWAREIPDPRGRPGDGARDGAYVVAGVREERDG